MSFPKDPQKALRLHLVADFAAVGLTPAQIVERLKGKLARDQWVDVEQVKRDLNRLVAIWRFEALANSQGIFGEIDERFRRVIAAQFDLYEQSEKPRVFKLPDGRTEVIPAATHLERSQILANAMRAITARSMHHFGARGGGQVTLNVQNNVNASQNTVVVPPENQVALDLREQANEIRRIMREERTEVNEKAPETQPKRLKTPVIEGVYTVEDAIQGELDDVARSTGALGRMAAKEASMDRLRRLGKPDEAEDDE